MDKIIREAISEIILDNQGLLSIPIKQKAKFEGWLKFELAYKLQQIGMELIEVESKAFYRRDRTDITFYHNENSYSIELKTSNTNWKIKDINPSSKPITKNIKSIINDAKKLNSKYGIVAFVLFPVPMNDNRWEKYIERISNDTGINLCVEGNCKQIEILLDDKNKCKLIVGVFVSKVFQNC